MRRIDASIGRRIEKTINGARPDTKMHDLGLALGLVSLLGGTDLGTYRDKNLEDVDPDARNVIAPRKAALDARIAALVKDRDISFSLDNARILGLMDVLGSSYRDEIQKFANYLGSDAFWDELAALGPSARVARVEREMLKLISLDKTKAHEVGAALVAKQIERDPETVLKNLTPRQGADAWDKILLLLANMIDRDRASESTATEDRISDAKKGGKFASTGKKVAQALRTSSTRLRIAAALGKKIPHRSFYAALSSDNPELLAQDATELTASEREAAGEAMKWAKKYGWAGRGITVMTSMLALAGLVTSWPPKDANGNIQWAEVGSGLALIGSIPTIAEFVKKDIGGLILKALKKEVASTAATAGTAVASTSKLAKAGAFLKGACKIIGPIGDAIFVCVNVAEALNEIKNEDTVGTYSRIGQALGGAMGVVGGIMLLSSSAALTGIGMPLALIGAAICLIAAVIDWGWGESEGAGRARRELRELGITTAEDRAFRSLATDSRTVTRYHGGYGAVMGSYQATERWRVDHSTVRKRAKTATTLERVGMINTFLEENTSGSEESLVYNVLRETPYAKGQFLELMEALDGRLLATELEHDGQAANVLLWTAKAYDLAGKAPGKSFLDQLYQHAAEHHEGAIDVFLKKIVVSGAGEDKLNREVYRKIDPAKLCEVTKKLLVGGTNRSEGNTVVRMLDLTSWPQFTALMEHGHLWYVRRLRSQLHFQQWKKVRSWMESKHTSATVKELAKERETAQRLTTEQQEKYFRGGSYTATVRSSNDTIRKRMKGTSRFEKVAVITKYLNNPSSRDEALVYHVLRETPYEKNEFLQVMEALPADRVARALEADADAALVMMWTLQAYHNAGRKPGKAFYDQLDAHCRYQRPSVINKFIDRVSDGGSTDKTIDRKIYQQVDPQAIASGSMMFKFDDDVTRNEAVAMYNMLALSSYTQFNQAIELGHKKYVELLKKSLKTAEWGKIHDWMTATAASPTVKHLAMQVRR